MAKVDARYATPGGGTVTLYDGGALGALVGRGAWYECTGCGSDRYKVTTWSERARATVIDYDATDRAAELHGSTCRRIPQ